MPRLGTTVASLVLQRRGATANPSSSSQLTVTTDFGANPGNLRMLTYAPADLGRGAGLVVVLHGCTQSAQAHAGGAGWLELAERHGFAVLCPEQDRANNPNLCFNWFQPGDTQRGQGEAASIRAMIVMAIKDYRIDPGRVFITGLSAGGAMANVMLATYPELFAAGAIMAGLPYGSASSVLEAFQAMSGQVSRAPSQWGSVVRAASTSRSRWPRISIWQGDDDYTVKPQVADAVAAQWVDVHGGEALKLTARATPGRLRTQTWRSPSGEAVVELHRISGMGHGVPLSRSGEDACGAPGAFLLDVGVSSSAELARSWGLMTALAPEVVVQRSAPSAAVARPSARSTDVGDIITKALRAAGLMK